MKGIFLTLLAFASISSYAFTPRINCHFDSSSGECSVVNDTPNTIACRLTIFGLTRMGYSFNGFEQVVLYPNQQAWAYVYAKNPMIDPLIDVHGSANCDSLLD